MGATQPDCAQGWNWPCPEHGQSANGCNEGLGGHWKFAQSRAASGLRPFVPREQLKIPALPSFATDWWTLFSDAEH